MLLVAQGIDRIGDRGLISYGSDGYQRDTDRQPCAQDEHCRTQVGSVGEVFEPALHQEVGDRHGDETRPNTILRKTFVIVTTTLVELAPRIFRTPISFVRCSTV